jgi:hypothetical protein
MATWQYKRLRSVAKKATLNWALSCRRVSLINDANFIDRDHAMNLSIKSCMAIACVLAAAATTPTFAQSTTWTVESDPMNNTAIGSDALANPNIDSDGGCHNTASGEGALQWDSSGSFNVGTGYGSLNHSTTGNNNTGLGAMTLYGNSSGSNNTATGFQGLYTNSTGSNNTATGYQALYTNNGTNNTANGYLALYSNTTGSRNNASGEGALQANTSANDNNAMGTSALHDNTTGTLNNAMGNFALEYNTTGNNNNAVGYGSLLNNINGSDNSAQGYFSLANNTSGSLNIAVGYKAGWNLTTGSNNIDIGNTGVAAESNIIRIGAPGTQSATFIAAIAGTNISGGTAVVVSSTGQLGVVSSSRRYKEDIQPMGDVSERLYQLRPVTFRYKQADTDGKRPVQVGLIAEDVAEVLPELVIYNSAGQPESVAYHLLPTLLLNELQKEHADLQQARALIAAQGQQLVDLKEQSADMQTLKAQVAELSSLRSEVAELRQLATQLTAPRAVSGADTVAVAQVTMAK